MPACAEVPDERTPARSPAVVRGRTYLPPGLLTTVCRFRGASELYLSAQILDGVEMGFAPPGIHEAAVVRWLTWAVEDLCPARRAADVPAKMAFHVGITKVQGEGFGGAAPLRVRALLRDPAIHRAVAGC